MCTSTSHSCSRGGVEGVGLAGPCLLLVMVIQEKVKCRSERPEGKGVARGRRSRRAPLDSHTRVIGGRGGVKGNVKGSRGGRM